MQSKNEALFIATYDSGYEEWLWIDAQIIRGGDHVAGGHRETEPAARNAPRGNI